jgi:ATP-dependent Clp protease ATP-binding subunit ClpB
LKRSIQRELETAIAKEILRGNFTEGDTIFVDVGETERLEFKRLPSEVLTTQ